MQGEILQHDMEQIVLERLDKISELISQRIAILIEQTNSLGGKYEEQNTI
jgi:hypothetical protein